MLMYCYADVDMCKCACVFSAVHLPRLVLRLAGEGRAAAAGGGPAHRGAGVGGVGEPGRGRAARPALPRHQPHG